MGPLLKEPWFKGSALPSVGIQEKWLDEVFNSASNLRNSRRLTEVTMQAWDRDGFDSRLFRSLGLIVCFWAEKQNKAIKDKAFGVFS